MKKTILIIILAFASQSNWAQNNCVLACNDNVEVALGNGLFELDYTSILEGNIDADCIPYLNVRLETSAGGIAIPYGTQLDLTCADIGSYTARVSVIENGNVLNSCWGNITVVNNQVGFDCPTLGPGMIPVTLTANVAGPYAYSVYLNGVELNQLSQTLYEMPEADLQAGINEISFDPLISGVNGVTSLDLVRIQKILDEITTTNTALELMAGDFDHSNYIGVKDLVEQRLTILGQIVEENSFFLAKSDLMNSNLDPFDFGEDMFSYRFDESAAATTDFTFNAYQSGDINFSFNLKGDEITENRSGETKLSFVDERVEEGQNIIVDFKANAEFNIEALQMSLLTSRFDVVNVNSNYSDAEFKHNLLSKEWRLSYLSKAEREQLEFSIELTPKYDGMLSEGLTLNQEFYQEAVHNINHTSEVILTQRGTTNTVDIKVNEISVSPMPIDGESTIKMSHSGTYGLSLVDMTGQIIKNTSFTGDTYQLSAEIFTNSGLYIVKIVEGSNVYTTKVVVTK